MTPSQVSALRVLGLVVAVLGGVIVLAALVEFVFVQSVDEHCPPDATCDGKALLSFVAMAVGAGGTVVAGLGGVLLVVARSSEKARRARTSADAFSTRSASAATKR